MVREWMHSSSRMLGMIRPLVVEVERVVEYAEERLEEDAPLDVRHGGLRVEVVGVALGDVHLVDERLQEVDVHGEDAVEVPHLRLGHQPVAVVQLKVVRLDDAEGEAADVLIQRTEHRLQRLIALLRQLQEDALEGLEERLEAVAVRHLKVILGGELITGRVAAAAGSRGLCRRLLDGGGLVRRATAISGTAVLGERQVVLQLGEVDDEQLLGVAHLHQVDQHLAAAVEGLEAELVEAAQALADNGHQVPDDEGAVLVHLRQDVVVEDVQHLAHPVLVQLQLQTLQYRLVGLLVAHRHRLLVRQGLRGRGNQTGHLGRRLRGRRGGGPGGGDTPGSMLVENGCC
ncbi:hypothetical protein TYRP_020485 [Tyrophagus putrescentiae]|nr:hypothetical protein TYRP_020485 [Tyrophagus putrescentiae]